MGERTETERETIDWFSSTCAPAGDQIHNLGMCPDWELNLQPFGVWDDVPTNWATRPGHNTILLTLLYRRPLELIYSG